MKLGIGMGKELPGKLNRKQLKVGPGKRTLVTRKETRTFSKDQCQGYNRCQAIGDLCLWSSEWRWPRGLGDVATGQRNVWREWT